MLHVAGSGFFVASSDAAVSRNNIYDGGNSCAIYEHNIDTAGDMVLPRPVVCAVATSPYSNPVSLRIR